MATLVLTAVGTALGGPIGGALGALAGRAVDGQLFPGKTREGARLSDLRVQTSSYGAPIPMIFGTMRVAGTVIWATELKETRNTQGGGKGRPRTTSYSYAASFAVLLSGRPIAGVGRIWADGQLLRGAAGDWKATTGFRLHRGGEDQPPDPLIVSVEGAARAPAHRGCAYAVLEGLQLAAFGNRIPSLSFEVIADAGPVGIGTMAATLAPGVTGAAAFACSGFVAADGTMRDVLAGTAAAAGAWFAPDGGSLVLRDAGVMPPPVPAMTLTVDPARDGWEVAAADRMPAEVAVRYFDPARDWQAGLQRARRAGRGAAQAIELPAAMSADAAKGVATAALARGGAARVRRTLGVGPEALALVPGDTVGIAGEGGDWRVDAVAMEGTGVTLTLSPLVRAPLPAPASGGRALTAPDRRIGATSIVVAELPPLDDALLTQPRLCVWASGSGKGWRGAALLLSLDGGASWTEAGATAAPAVMGVLDAPMAAGPATLADRCADLVVRLARADMMLGDATTARLDAGANLALVGGELLQFGRAEPLGDGRWRLRELWRGRRATGSGGVPSGAPFVLIDADSTRTIDLPLATLGGIVRVMASGIGDEAPATADAAIRGASVLPPAPVAMRLEGTVVRWTRRSRIGWRWSDAVDAPLGEERELYRAVVVAGSARREAALTAPELTLLPGERVAGTIVTVRQCGTLGDSPTTTFTI